MTYDPTDPAGTPDDPDQPVGEVIDVVPGALVRQPAGSRRPNPADAPSSSVAGLDAHRHRHGSPAPAIDRDRLASAIADWLDGAEYQHRGAVDAVLHDLRDQGALP